MAAMPTGRQYDSAPAVMIAASASIAETSIEMLMVLYRNALRLPTCSLAYCQVSAAPAPH